MSMAKPAGSFGWIDTFTSDIESAKSFYQGLFGWEHRDLPTDVGVDYTEFQLNGSRVAGMSPMPPEMAAEGLLPQWMSYVIVDDADAVCEATRAAGGQVMMAPMDVMDSGRLANLMDPAGGFFGIWQPYSHTGVEVAGVPGSLVWNELQTRDLMGALPYYEQVFGWEWERGDAPGYEVARLDGQSVCGAEDMPGYVPEEVPAVWLVYFAVRDTEACAQLAVDLGGKVFLAPTQEEHGLTAGILDPNGGRFMVVQQG